ncbi:MAG: peptidase [Ignavibacteria bacterium RBG_16_35_7]|nr:MAG: peptidase [Ignavibacteria bacterium RBG_16_35_7]
MDSKRYNNIKLAVGIIEGVLTFILIYIFIVTGLSYSLEEYLSAFISNTYLQFICFAATAGAVMGILFLPFSYYSGFYLEHKYNLSNQTFFKWVWENVKGLLVSAVIGLPLLLFFFYVINRYGIWWWLPLAIGLFFFSVILARLVPIIILPIFYKVTPLENESLRGKIENLAHKAGMKVQNIYSFNMSKNTKKANAAFTGLGKSKRILLGDTLLDSYTEDEVETVIAHELGHYKKKHIIKNLLIGTFSSFFTLYVIAAFYNWSLPWFGFTSIKQIAALPILSLWGMFIGLFLSPLTNIISRKFEYEADKYAVVSTNKVSSFISVLEKLTEQNLGDKNPHPFVEWFFYSHPSISKRISAIQKFAQEKGLF